MVRDKAMPVLLQPTDHKRERGCPVSIELDRVGLRISALCLQIGQCTHFNNSRSFRLGVDLRLRLFPSCETTVIRVGTGPRLGRKAEGVLIGHDASVRKNKAVAAVAVPELSSHFSNRLNRKSGSTKGRHFIHASNSYSPRPRKKSILPEG